MTLYYLHEVCNTYNSQYPTEATLEVMQPVRTHHPIFLTRPILPDLSKIYPHPIEPERVPHLTLREEAGCSSPTT